MTKDQWINNAIKNKEALRSFILSYHPSMRTPKKPLPITAPGAEAACENIRQEIAKENIGNPVEQFDRAIEGRDFTLLYHLLNATWFGVPESTDCWRIKGFSEAVDLMDDTPEEEE